VDVPSEEKSENSKNSFCEELEKVFDRFSKYYMRILLRDFSAKVRSENIFKPTIGNESLHQDNNDNGVGIVNFATSKILLSSAQCSHTETFKSTPRPLLMGRLTTRLITY